MAAETTLQDWLDFYDKIGVASLDACITDDGSTMRGQFEEAVALLNTPSPFNKTLSLILRNAAKKYAAGDEFTVDHFTKIEYCQQMLKDLHEAVQKKAANLN